MLTQLLISLILVIIPLISESNEQLTENATICINGNSAKINSQKLIVVAILCHDDDMIYINITYNEYNNNWFGIVFGADMYNHDSLIYTTGQNSDRNESLYFYRLWNHHHSGVIYMANKDWTEVLNDENHNVGKQVIYKQALLDTDWSLDTTSIQFRYAMGHSLQLDDHNVKSQHVPFLLDFIGSPTIKPPSSSIITNRPTMRPTLRLRATEEDLTLEIIHGVIMWTTWSVIASIGIMLSAFRWLLPKQSIWFRIHRGMQATVVILNMIGFIVAIIFTVERGNTHFDNAHMIIGLIVTIISILQPINAYFRPYQKYSQLYEDTKIEKTTIRVFWEYMHKGCGYMLWIFGCVNIMLGLQLIDQDLLSYLHMFLWCGLLLIVYITLSFVAFVRKKEEKQIVNVSAVNEELPKDTDNMIVDSDTMR